MLSFRVLKQKRQNTSNGIDLFLSVHFFFVFFLVRWILFTVDDVSAARSELPLRDNVDECLLFKYDVCVMPFCRCCTR